MLKKIIHRLKWKFYAIQSKLFQFSKIKMKNGLVMKLGTKNEHEMHRAKTFYSKEPEMIEWLNRLSANYKKESFLKQTLIV